MPTPGQPVPVPVTANSKRPAEIFRVGTYDGKQYDRQFLQNVVDNYNRYQKRTDPRFPRPPAYYASAEFAKKIGPPLSQGAPDLGIGHENDQAYLRWLLGRTDLPSAGWPTNLRLDGDTLLADFEDMPSEVASLVNGGQLAHCSAEFYPNYIDESGKQYGPALRRVSLLGGEVPKVKGLAPNPTMVFSEPGTGLPVIAYFSEGFSQMDRQKLIAGLQSAGIDTSWVTDAIPDAALSTILNGVTAKTASTAAMTAGTGNTTLPPAPVTTASEPKPATDTNPVKKADQAANAPNAFADCGGMAPMKKFADSLVGMTDDQRDNAANTFAEAIRHGVNHGINAVVNPILQQLGLLTQQVTGLVTSNTTRQADEDRRTVVAFCERMRDEGRVTPFELATVDEKGKPKPSLVDVILGLDNGQAVLTFGEEKVTQRGQFVKMIELRPGQMRREKIGAPMNNSGDGRTPPANDQTWTEEQRASALSKSQTGRAIMLREIREGKMNGKYLTLARG